jgi:hypothetical protein
MSILKQITRLLDKVCYLYKRLDNGENATEYDFTKLLDVVVELCSSNSNKDVLCLLLSYYSENDVIRNNKFMYNEPRLENIISDMLNNKNLEISYEELNAVLKTLHYEEHEAEDSLYRRVKDKVIILNRSRLDKSKYTFYDFQDMFNNILEEFMDDYYEEDQVSEEFTEIYDKLMEVLGSENCNVTDDQNSTLLTFLLSKHYNNYCREIRCNDTVYSIKNMINIIIKNENFNWNIRNCYGFTQDEYLDTHMEEFGEEESDEIMKEIRIKCTKMIT